MKTYKGFIEENTGAYVAGYAVGYFGASLLFKGIKKAKKAFIKHKYKKEALDALKDIEKEGKKYKDEKVQESTSKGGEKLPSGFKNYLIKKLNSVKKSIANHPDPAQLAKQIGYVVAVAAFLGITAIADKYGAGDLIVKDSRIGKDLITDIMDIIDAIKGK